MEGGLVTLPRTARLCLALPQANQPCEGLSWDRGARSRDTETCVRPCRREAEQVVKKAPQSEHVGRSACPMQKVCHDLEPRQFKNAMDHPD
jgi:hypothetical protein